jgi:hypothetical protein
MSFNIPKENNNADENEDHLQEVRPCGSLPLLDLNSPRKALAQRQEKMMFPEYVMWTLIATAAASVVVVAAQVRAYNNK